MEESSASRTEAPADQQDQQSGNSEHDGDRPASSSSWLQHAPGFRRGRPGVLEKVLHEADHGLFDSIVLYEVADVGRESLGQTRDPEGTVCHHRVSPGSRVAQEDGEHRRATSFKVPRGEEAVGERNDAGERILPRGKNEDVEARASSHLLDQHRQPLATRSIEDGSVIGDETDRTGKACDDRDGRERNEENGAGQAV